MPDSRAIKHVLATVDYGPDQLRHLADAFAPARFTHVAADDEAGIRDALATADVAVLRSDLDQRFLGAPALRWVHCDHAGPERSASPAVFERGLIVTSSAGRSAPALAHHVMFFALALAFDAPGLLEQQRARRWRGPTGYEDRLSLWGKTMGVIGLGNTGRELGPLAKAFGMRTLGYRRRAGEVPGFDRVYAADRGELIEQLLAESDVVAITAPLTDRTYRMIGARELTMMKRSAYLINLGRGRIVDEAALVRALRDGVIAGAGLDVFEEEPLPETAEIWRAPNVIITPHMTPKMPDRTERSIAIITENIRRFRAGESLVNQLQPEDVFSG